MSWLNRPIYSLLLRLAAPLLLLRLLLRGRKEPAYTQLIGQRLGFYGPLQPVRGALWLHAVSLGEMRTAALLIRQWRLQNPDTPLLLTCSTATGRAEGENLLDAHTQLIWLPWDMPGAVKRFLRAFKPSMGLLMETEVWPNISHYCAQRNIPLILINARLSDKSLRQALRLPALALPAYQALSGAWAQSARDADHLRQLGCRVLGISGNIKFDVQINSAQIEQALVLKKAWRQMKILTLASSRDGEEALFLEALKTCRLAANTIPLIVPRHPQRFADIEMAAQRAGWNVLKRDSFSAGNPPHSKTLLLGNSMGEMAFYYGLSDVALIGGSYLPYGGQNLIEAIACYCAVVLGPHTFNFQEASLLAEEAGLATRAQTMQEAVRLAQQHLSEPPHTKDIFTKFLQKNQGGIQRTLSGIRVFEDVN